MIKPAEDLALTKLKISTERIKAYLKDNIFLIVFFWGIVLAAYGFELFNINLTIDEELAALRTEVNQGFVTSNRWGLYILTKVLLPKQVIPFLPLALALFFQFAAILIFLDLLQIQKKADRIVISGIGLIWPGLAYLYSFSFVNFAVGFGFLCISLALFILVRAKKRLKLLAVIPIAFVFSIYQPLLQPLVMVFLFYLIYNWQKTSKDLNQFISYAILTTALGCLLYLGIQKLFLLAFQTESSDYISHFFDFSNLFQNVGVYILKLWNLFYNVMVGDATFYGVAVRALPLFLLVGGGLAMVHEFKHREKMSYYLLFLVLLGIFSVLPFIGGILTKGYIPYRSLLGVPIFLMGWAALALKHTGSKTRLILSVLAVTTLFQFAISMNHLFASSAFAYEEDKFLAGQLVQRIEEEKEKTGSTEVAYLELVGYVDRPTTPLVSRIENIGASFFGWDGGNPTRAAAFLRILGYDHLEALPLERRVDYVLLGESMPAWPKAGSVQVIDNVIVIKFGAYSRTQKMNLCELDEATRLPTGFCVE